MIIIIIINISARPRPEGRRAACGHGGRSTARGAVVIAISVRKQIKSRVSNPGTFAHCHFKPPFENRRARGHAWRRRLCRRFAAVVAALSVAVLDAGVCEQKHSSKNTRWDISFQSTKSGAGLQFLLLGRMAKSQVKGMFVQRHRYHPSGALS